MVAKAHTAQGPQLFAWQGLLALLRIVGVELQANELAMSHPLREDSGGILSTILVCFHMTHLACHDAAGGRRITCPYMCVGPCVRTRVRATLSATRRAANIDYKVRSLGIRAKAGGGSASASPL